jgi:hypothetical protein
MITAESIIKVTLMRTLWLDTYRAGVVDETNGHLATLRIIPHIPLEREELPPDAPEAIPFISILVEQANISPEEFIFFESKVSDQIMSKMQTDAFKPEFCRFFYPSPSFMLKEMPIRQ